MGCGNKSSDKSQSNSRTLLSGISYPAMSENNIVEFSKSDFTTGAIRSIEQIPLDMTIENRELGIYIKGNYLLVKHLERRKGAHLLHVISLPDYKIAAELAPFGEGPDEFTDIRIIDTEEIDKLCYIRNLYTNQLFCLSPSLELKECGKFLAFPEFTGQTEGSLYLGDNNMLTDLGSGDGLGMCAVNQKDSTIKGIIPFHFEEGTRGFFYIGNMVHSFSKRRIARTFTYHDRLVFFDFDDNRYVYAIYRKSQTDADKSNPLYLEQFDWDGNLIARYPLPEGRGFFSGCATENDSVIYLVDYYEDHFLHKIILRKG